MSDKIIKIGDKYLSINGDYELVENMSAATRFDDLENLEAIPMTISQGAIIHDLLDWVVISVNEKEVAAAKRQYNSNVNRFNTYIQKFPTNIIASIFSVKEVKLYEIEDKIKRQTPINGNLNL